MPEFALFANFENTIGDSPRALNEAVETIVLAETLGFDQIWLTEHHFNPFSVSASILPLLAHLAGRTHRIKLGAAALLLPFHDPVKVAEDVATIDALSNGRLMLGVARGGPFPEQFRHFGVDPEASRERLFEGLALLERLLAETSVDHSGTHFHCSRLSIHPRPLRPRLPIWLASLSETGVALAASKGYGLMGPSAAPLARIKEHLARFAALQTGPVPTFVLARYFLCDADGERARRASLPFIRDFAANMRAVFHSAPALQPFGQAPSTFSEESLLANAIVGSPTECVQQILALQEAIGPHVLLLKPAAYDIPSIRNALILFAEQVRPRLSPDAH